MAGQRSGKVGGIACRCKASDAAAPLAIPGARWLPTAARILAASVGGYALAAWFSVAAVGFSADAANAVMWGMLGSFWVWVGAVVWAFAARTAWQAWLGLGIAALGLLPFVQRLGA